MMDPVEKESERRRSALTTFLEKMGVSPTEAASRARLKSANALFNFLNGHSRELSEKTNEQLAAAFPGCTVAEILGLTERQYRYARDTGSVSLGKVARSNGQLSLDYLLKPMPPLRPKAPTARRVSARRRSFEEPRQAPGHVRVSYEIAAGELKSSPQLPPADQFMAPMPIDPQHLQSGVYGAVVRGPGMDARQYRDGTIVLAAPLSRFSSSLAPGRKVLLQRISDGLVEICCREVVHQDGHVWLWPRSTHPNHQQPVEWPHQNVTWLSAGDRYSVVGVVLSAYLPGG